MLANKKGSKDDLELAKFFRSFELSTEFRELLYSKKPIYYHLPQLIKGVIEYQFLTYYFARVPKWRLLVRKLVSKKRIVPNYVMTGPIKNGSSDLVSHLLMHPNIMHPLAKEMMSLQLKNWRAYYPTVKEKQRLEEKSDHIIRCGYLEPFLNNMTLMDKLYDLNPQSKIIITLRDPVARAYSQWKWEIFLGGEGLKKDSYFESFNNYTERALEFFPSISMKTVCGFPVLQTGIYHNAVEHWINRFGRENVLVLDVAEYFSNRQPTLEKMQRFLDLPVIHIPEYGKKANENPIQLPPPDQKTKAALAEFYRPYNQKLFDIIGTDFDWK
ncbi:MAG: hypothetical protein ACI9SP_000762 [Arenicella sp.]|jgi:hypothetical protein